MLPPTIAIDDVYALDGWKAADSAALRRLDLDPDTARFFGWTVEAARALPASHYDGPTRESSNLAEWREGKRLNLSIRRRGDRAAVGWVELRPDGDTAEVSYNVAQELRGQGLAVRALNALLGWASSSLELRQASLLCHPENVASQRVAEKCGFVFVRQAGDHRRYERLLG